MVKSYSDNSPKVQSGGEKGLICFGKRRNTHSLDYNWVCVNAAFICWSECGKQDCRTQTFSLNNTDVIGQQVS